MLLKSLIALPFFLSAVLVEAAAAADPPPPVEAATDSSANPVNPLKATIDVSFPDTDSPLGVTVVNGRVSKINIAFQNNEPDAIAVDVVGGALWDADHKKILKNLTAVKVNNKIQPEQKVNIPYSFITDMHAQDVILELGLVMTLASGNKVPYTAFNGTISVAEPPTSFLDPQLLFLYLILTSIVGGIGYFAYSTWVVPLLPKKKKVRAAQPVRVEPVRASGTDLSGKSYDESWIPEQHLKKPTAVRVKSGGSQRIKTQKKAE